MDDLRFTIAPADLCEDDFMAKYGGIYEHAPWVAARLFGAGLGPQDSRLSIFAGRMADIVDTAGHDAQLALLRAHPELAGKLAIAGGLTSESTAEQAGAGLDAPGANATARLVALDDLGREPFAPGPWPALALRLFLAWLPRGRGRSRACW